MSHRQSNSRKPGVGTLGALLLTLGLSACGGGGSGDLLAPVTAADAVGAKQLDVVLVEASAASPANVNGSCVIFTPQPGVLELVANIDELNFPVFRHIGQGIQDCLEGRALPYLSEIPANNFFHQTLTYQRNGQCTASWAVGCYADGLIHIVPANIPARVVPGTPAWNDYEAAVLGHETWHAVDLCFHGCSPQ